MLSLLHAIKVCIFCILLPLRRPVVIKCRVGVHRLVVILVLTSQKALVHEPALRDANT